MTVTDIDPPTPDATAILLARDYEGVGADGNVEPFEPFELEPGSTRWVYVGSTLPMCRAPAPGDPQQHRLRVHFELYGIPRTTWVDMGETFRRFVEEDGGPCIAEARPE